MDGMTWKTDVSHGAAPNGSHRRRQTPRYLPVCFPLFADVASIYSKDRMSAVVVMQALDVGRPGLGESEGKTERVLLTR